MTRSCLEAVHFDSCDVSWATWSSLVRYAGSHALLSSSAFLISDDVPLLVADRPHLVVCAKF